MKDINEFCEKLVTIDFIEKDDCYGYYPFHLFVEEENGDIVMGVLAGINAQSGYLQFKQRINEGAKRVYMSLDFPAGMDMETDFVAIFYYEEEMAVNVPQLFAIPYNKEDGTRLPVVAESKLLDHIRMNYHSIESPVDSKKPNVHVIAGNLKEGDELGDTCYRNGCEGIIESSQEDESCFCHITPPCAKCTDEYFYCPECDWNNPPEDDE